MVLGGRRVPFVPLQSQRKSPSRTVWSSADQGRAGPTLYAGGVHLRPAAQGVGCWDGDKAPAGARDSRRGFGRNSRAVIYRQGREGSQVPSGACPKEAPQV